MITDFETNTIYFSELLKTEKEFTETFQEISGVLGSTGIKPKLLPKTKDIWARDYMPIQVTEEKYVEYRYDPDYLLSTAKGHRDSKTYPDIVCDAMGRTTLKSDIILDGGNVIRSKEMVIMTDKVVSENKSAYSRSALLEELKRLFEVERVILIPWDLQEEFGHADGMVRFIDEETVLVNNVYKGWDKLTHKLRKEGLKIEYLQYQVNSPNKDLNWAYINFLQTKDIILIPKLGIEEDHQALEHIRNFYPDYARRDRIFQINMMSVVNEGGALNCISWTTKE